MDVQGRIHLIGQKTKEGTILEIPGVSWSKGMGDENYIRVQGECQDVERGEGPFDQSWLSIRTAIFRIDTVEARVVQCGRSSRSRIRALTGCHLSAVDIESCRALISIQMLNELRI